MPLKSKVESKGTKCVKFPHWCYWVSLFSHYRLLIYYRLYNENLDELPHKAPTNQFKLWGEHFEMKDPYRKSTLNYTKVLVYSDPDVDDAENKSLQEEINEPGCKSLTRNRRTNRPTCRLTTLCILAYRQSSVCVVNKKRYQICFNHWP